MKKPAPPLPPACPLCRPYGGRWRSVEGGLARCLCPRGEALAAGKVKRVMGGSKAFRAEFSQVPASAEPSSTNRPPVQHDGKRLAAGKDT